MSQLRITKNIKLEDLEACYASLYKYITKNVTVDLLLPKVLDNNYLGLVPALYQFAITWVRYPNSGKLLLEIEDPEQTDFEKLYENELLYPVVSLVWNKNGVFNETGKQNLRSYLKPNNKEVFKKMKGVQEIDLFGEYTNVSPLKGHKLLLTLFDHLPEEDGVLPCFEINGEFIKNESTFKDRIRTGVDQILSYSREVKSNFIDASDELIGVVFELMKNTDEWAKDNKGAPLDPSMRGLLFKFYKKRRVTLCQEFEKHNGLKTYFQSKVLKENSIGELYLMELSVFDSGIGFVGKNELLKKEGLADVDIVKKCLIKHNTSSKDLGKEDKGIGLDRILTILDKKGFLRIKTGNVCVYRNMINHNYKAIDRNDIKAMELFDWEKNSNTDYTTFNMTEGTVITIIYPLHI